jgi:hypothetical protein
LGPQSARPPEIELFEIFHRREKAHLKPPNSGDNNRFVVVADTQANPFTLPLLKWLLRHFMNRVNRNARNRLLCAQESLLRKGHIINYEEWFDRNAFERIEMNHFARAAFRKARENPQQYPHTSLQTYEIFHEAGTCP